MANAYYNDLIVPDNLMWKNNNRRLDKTGLLGSAGIKTLALLFECALLLLITYAINQAVLSNTEEKLGRNAIANRTVKRHIVITLCFIVVLIWASFSRYW